MKGIPHESAEIMLASLSDSSWKQYNTGLRKWWEFCESKDQLIDPCEASIPDILRFLSEAFEKGASYGTLNSYRSAISLLLNPDIAQDHKMKRFFKGISRLRPAKARYNSTWNPKIVLDYYRNMPSNEDLPIQELSFKLIILLALTTGHRLQTFSLIKINNIREMEDAIEIRAR